MEDITQYIEENKRLKGILDTLARESDWHIRLAVAEQGYGLDQLINDPEPEVRAAVAEQGYGLDQLINDPNEYVREAVAMKDYGLRSWWLIHMNLYEKQ